MAAKIVRLVPHERSNDTIRALEILLADAMDGKLIGLAYVAMYQAPQEYVLDVAGETKRSPIFTRGLLPELDYELGKIIRGDHG